MTETTAPPERTGQELISPNHLPPVVFSVTDKALAALREKNKDVTEVTPENYDVVKANLKELVTLRTGIEAERNEQLKAAREHTNNVNTEAKRVTALVQEIEGPVKKLKADYDAEQKRIKEEAERKEKERTDKINAKIDAFEEAGRNLDGMTAQQLSERLALLKDTTPSEEDFEEFHAVAVERLESTVARLTVAHSKRVEFELAEQKRKEEEAKLAKEREELEAERRKLQEERDKLKAEREAAAAEEQKEADRKAKIKAEAERKAREKQIADEAAAKALADKEAAEEAEKQARLERELMAPDKDKLYAYASKLDTFIDSAPELSNDKARKVLGRCLTSLQATHASLLDTAGRL